MLSPQNKVEGQVALVDVVGHMKEKIPELVGASTFFIVSSK